MKGRTTTYERLSLIIILELLFCDAKRVKRCLEILQMLNAGGGVDMFTSDKPHWRLTLGNPGDHRR